MAGKGFLIEKELSELGLNLNIPPFASSDLHYMKGRDIEQDKEIMMAEVIRIDEKTRTGRAKQRHNETEGCVL